MTVTVTVIAWIVEGTWQACVDAASTQLSNLGPRSLSPATRFVG